MPNHLYILLQLFPDKPWNFERLSQNPNITFDIVKKYPTKPWDWNALSQNPGITWDIIKENPHESWDWKMISANKNITWDIVRNNPDKPWDIFSFSENSNVTWTIIKENLHRTWSWKGLSRNRNITLDMAKELPSKPWDWDELTSRYPRYRYTYSPSEVNYEIKEAFSHFTLSGYNEWWHLSRKVPLHVIEENPNKRWIWDSVSINNFLTWKFVKENIDKPWDWDKMSQNRFIFHNKIVKIQRFYRRKKLSFQVWRKNIEWVNVDIKFSPHLNGIEFQKIKEEIEADATH